MAAGARVRALDAHELRLRSQVSLPRRARLQVLRPRPVLQCVRLQGGTRLRRRLPSLGDEDVAVPVVHRAELRDVDGHDEVRGGHSPRLVRADGEVQRPAQDLEHRRDLRRPQLALAQVHGDHDVRAHLPHDVGREVVHDAAVRVDVVADANGREEAGDGHRRAQGLGQRTVREDPLLAAHQLRGHAAERDGQLVEGFDLGVGHRLAIHQQRDLLSRVQSRRQAHAVAEADQERVRVRAQVFTPAEGQVPIGRGPGEHEVPVELMGQGAELSGSLPGRVEAADQGAHAGARDVVHGDVVGLEPLEHADVGQAEGAPAFEGHADLRAWARLGAVAIRRLRGRGDDDERGEEQPRPETHAARSRRRSPGSRRGRSC